MNFGPIPWRPHASGVGALMAACALAALSAPAAAQQADIPPPDPDAPVYIYALQPDLVPATDYAPATTAPDQPVDVWAWRFQTVETDGFDTTASRTRVDCAAGTFQFLGHALFRDGELLGMDPTPGEPTVPEPDSTAAGLLMHICDPDPDWDVWRLPGHRDARATVDDFFSAP